MGPDFLSQNLLRCWNGPRFSVTKSQTVSARLSVHTGCKNTNCRWCAWTNTLMFRTHAFHLEFYSAWSFWLIKQIKTANIIWLVPFAKHKSKRTDANHFLHCGKQQNYVTSLWCQTKMFSARSKHAENLKTVAVGSRTFRLHGLLGSTGWDRAIDHAGSHQQELSM